jgi:hypothetical protein
LDELLAHKNAEKPIICKITMEIKALKGIAA